VSTAQAARTRLGGNCQWEKKEKKITHDWRQKSLRPLGLDRIGIEGKFILTSVCKCQQRDNKFDGEKNQLKATRMLL
jgi:hypothetical protein